MYLCLELDPDVHELYLIGEGAFEVVFFDIIIHIDESEWPNGDWILEDDGSEEILDVQLVKDEDLG